MSDLERMAREAGAFTPGKAGDYWAVTEEALARLEAMIRADERERCAKVCEDNAPSAPSYFEIAERLRECAAEIRGNVK